MLRRLALVIALLVAPPAGAEILGAAEFEAFTEGRTLHFDYAGQHFGSEQFFSGRRSLWRFSTGECASGIWYPQGDQICFVYEGDDLPRCWITERRGGGVSATLADEAAAPFSVDLSHVDQEPLNCPGPRVGS